MAVAYSETGKHYPGQLKGRPYEFWFELFAVYHTWQWTAQDMGNYIRMGVSDPADDYVLVRNVFDIIRNERMRLFFKGRK
jgi:hypothetical protein